MGSNTLFVVATLADDHVVGTVVISKNSFESSGGEAKTAGNIGIKAIPKS